MPAVMSCRSLWRCAAIPVLVFFIELSPSAAAAQDYAITDLGTLCQSNDDRPSWERPGRGMRADGRLGSRGAWAGGSWVDAASSDDNDGRRRAPAASAELSVIPKPATSRAGRRPASILSPRAYNAKTRLASACPITSRAKGHPFDVALPVIGKVTGRRLSR
jgi:hypothetical protein